MQKHKHEQAQSKLADAEKKLRLSTFSLSMAKALVHDKDKEIDELKASNKEKQAELAKLKTTNKEMQAEIESLRAQVEVTTQNEADLLTKLAMAECALEHDGPATMLADALAEVDRLRRQ